MKTGSTLIISVAILVLFCCDSTDPDQGQIDLTKGKEIVTAKDSNIPDNAKVLYQEDAARIALRDIHDIESIKETLVEIPADLIDLYYNGLIHLYNATSIAARDSVVAMYDIHAWPYPETHRLLVAVDSTKQWVNAWRNGQRMTGNSRVDKLMKRYDLQLDRYYKWPWSHTAVLFSPSPINILALAKRFANIDGVGYAEPDGYIGDGNDITASIEPHYLRYEYSVGYGDCPSGCINRRYWVFHVDYDGAVEFVESFGNPAP